MERLLAPVLWPASAMDCIYSPWDCKGSDTTEQLSLHFTDGSVVKNLPANVGDEVSIPGSGRSPGEGNGHTPVFLPGKPHGQRSLAGHSPRSHKESDMT